MSPITSNCNNDRGSSMTSKLTKKQRKALAHRERHKNKLLPTPDDEPDNALPELDIQNEQDQAEASAQSELIVPTTPPQPKKRKRSDESELPNVEAEDQTKTQKPKAKRPKVASDDKDDPSKKPKQKKGRYILFVGNLSYKTTVESITAHFTPPKTEKATQPPKAPSVRLLTSKVAPGATPKSRTKGCAFVEFHHAPALQAALKLHHTELDGRRINVELTAGGGGSGEQRREKVVERNRKLMEERLKADPNRPPANYGYTTIRHSTTSGAPEAPSTVKTWTASENASAHKMKKVRGTKTKSGLRAAPNVPDTRLATGANATLADRKWGAKKKKP